MWDVLTFSELLSVECTGEVCHLAVSSSKLYGRCSRERFVRVWDLGTIDLPVVKLDGHADYINCMTISGNRLFTGSLDNTIRVWDLTNHTEIACLRAQSSVSCLTISGNRLYSGGYDHTIRVWDLDTFTETACIAADNKVGHIQISAGKMFLKVDSRIIVRLI